MNPIVARLKQRHHGPGVADLQDALLFLVDHRVIQSVAPPGHPTDGELDVWVVKVLPAPLKRSM
jgi:hypothetical protein